MFSRQRRRMYGSVSMPCQLYASRTTRCVAMVVAVAASTVRSVGHADEPGPPLPAVLTNSAEMADRLDAAAKRHAAIAVSSVGRSVEGKDLLAVHVDPDPDAEPRWKVLFIGAQHGDEHAGKEAILDLIDDIAAGTFELPKGVELWAVPMANPDGVDKDQRRNANDFDLNRDHLILSQPETVALHKLVQHERPQVIVDCHEFTRDSKSYTDKGWGEWPLIMMDSANSPLLPDNVLDVGLPWVTSAGPTMQGARHNYRRYTVGGPPPDAELRYSTLDPDDARNGLSFYDGLGFIIESGIKRSADAPQTDLPERVAAYRLLLRGFLTDGDLREATLGALNDGPYRSKPFDIVTNALWVHKHRGVLAYPVIDLDSGETISAWAWNLAERIAVKRRVAIPSAYAVPTRQADAYADLLDKHTVTYERLDAPRTVSAELATLDRIEEDFDPVYQRYGGRQIVNVEMDEAYELLAGSLWIDLAKLAEQEPMMARRAIKVLEPQQLYGLYQWPQWRDTVDDDGMIPIVRVMAAD